jgi:hypothetical protein
MGAATIAGFGDNSECADELGFGGSAGRSLPRATRAGDEALDSCKGDGDDGGIGTVIVFGLA